MTRQEAINILLEHFSEGLVRTIVDALKQEQDEPVAWFRKEEKNDLRRKKHMEIYTRINVSAVFVWPALAFSIEDDFWIELAWLGFAIGLSYES